MKPPLLILAAFLLPVVSADGRQGPGPLTEQLLQEGAAQLASDAFEQGDARRGAILFYQPAMACRKCHDGGKGLGPNLAGKPEIRAEHVIESILEPSREITDGYRTTLIATTDGRTLSGLLAEEDAERVILRDPTQDGKRLAIDRADIEERRDDGPSIMPPALADQLGSRQDFLDLVRYVAEIAEQGPARAAELEPAPFLYEPTPLPEYEARVDHSGLIAALDSDSLDRGGRIYERACASCHGTREQPGSLPTAPRFFSATLKNGADPHGMYRTLTQGFGLMAPQTWMVPRQKYDVIHYIRETFFRSENPASFIKSDADYLAKLPVGDTFGPEPSTIDPWGVMDYGPSLMNTFEIGDDESNFAYKGIAVRLDPGPGGVTRGRHWMVFDHDTLRVAGAWSGEEFIDYNGIQFNGRHHTHPRVIGRVHFENPIGPGWADPTTGGFEDPRPLGRDDRPYGPLPRDRAHYQGLYQYKDRVILSYQIDDVAVLESPGVELGQDVPIFNRIINVGPRVSDLMLRVACHPFLVETENALATLLGPLAILHRSPTIDEPGESLVCGVSGDDCGLEWSLSDGGDLLLKIPAGEEARHFVVRVARLDEEMSIELMVSAVKAEAKGLDLDPLTRGGPPRWPEVIESTASSGEPQGPFTIDTLEVPVSNPWLAMVRPTGFDFLPEGHRAAICTWDGDVWIVSGLDDPKGRLAWRRIASGLFQPLGLVVRDGRILVGCRDQIVLLHDLNGNGEIDFYENFNNDHQVTEHFHEFAMGLQVDPEGNLYYAKAARHAHKALVPQHGTLLRVSPDGDRTDILASGFRAPNGVCLNPDGSFFVTDQEGHWIPKNRINHVRDPGKFFGNIWGFHDVTDPSDAAMEPPLCWITNAMDRSPAEPIWVTSPAWGPLQGSLLNISYGEGKLYVVPHEFVQGQAQGGVVTLPIPLLPTGTMRGRFDPTDGQLYLCGMFAWAGNRQEPGGFYRVRHDGGPAFVPIGLKARRSSLKITFDAALDPTASADPASYSLKVWSLHRSEKYGSEHVDERPLRVASVSLSDNGRTVTLEVPDIKATMSMSISYAIRSRGGQPVRGMIHNTIHHLGKE
ncbi:c-type cytochrome [soil metagenome]